MMREDRSLIRRMHKNAAGRGVISVAMFLSPFAAMADAWQIEPTVRLQQEYDDNFRLTDGNEDKVYTSKLVGAAKLSRLTETMDINGVIRLDLVKYFGDTDDLKDRNNQLAGFDIDKKWERTRLGLKTLFQRDTVLRSANLIVDPGDVSVEPDQTVDDNISNQNVRRIRTNIRPTVTYNVTERSNIRVGYRYFNTHYSDRQGADLGDFTKNTATVGSSTRVTEKDRLLVRAQASRFDPDDGENTDNFELQAGLRHEFDETTNVIATLGGRHTRIDNPDGGTDSDNGFVARLEGEKLSDLTRYNLLLQRRLSPSGSGKEVQTTEVNFNINRKLTPFFSFSLRSRAYENKSIGPRASGSSRRRFDIRPTLAWTFARNWSLEGGYQYIRQKRFDSPDSVDSNSVFISLNFRQATPLDNL